MRDEQINECLRRAETLRQTKGLHSDFPSLAAAHDLADAVAELIDLLEGRIPD